MDSTDLTIEILQGIRTDIQHMGRSLGERLDKTNERLERTNERLDAVVHEQMRTSTAVAETNRVLGELAREVGGLNARLDNVLLGPLGQSVHEHGARLTTLEKQMARLTQA